MSESSQTPALRNTAATRYAFLDSKVLRRRRFATRRPHATRSWTRKFSDAGASRHGGYTLRVPGLESSQTPALRNTAATGYAFLDSKALASTNMTSSTSLGFWSFRGPASEMKSPHSHEDVEINVVHEGSLEYSFGGGRLEAEPSECLVFWAAVPHTLTRSNGAVCTWVTLPLNTILGWGLPEGFIHRVIGGVPFRSSGLTPLDSAILSWPENLGSGNKGLVRAVELEVQSFLWRISSETQTGFSRALQPTLVDQMSGFVVANYDKPISVSQIAEAVGVHPSHAMKLFKSAMGCTLVEYITQYRIYHAKRLLATTDLLVEQVAYQSGFSSERRFFEAFRALVGQSPARYRKQLTFE